MNPSVNLDMQMKIEGERAVPSVLCWCDTDQNEALVREVLTASGYNFTIVRADHSPGCGHPHKAGMAEFEREMRSGAYNLFLLLSPDHPLEGHLADELAEMVNAGAGLLLTDPKDVSHFRTHPAKTGVVDPFGIKEKGSLPSSAYSVSLKASPITDPGTLSFTGSMKKLEICDAQSAADVKIGRAHV